MLFYCLLVSASLVTTRPFHTLMSVGRKRAFWYVKRTLPLFRAVVKSTLFVDKINDIVDLRISVLAMLLKRGLPKRGNPQRA